ncbi:MAG: AEC family transporter [Clostridia bacterium]|nr:AEC family transporter [Clostridia bacterium]
MFESFLTAVNAVIPFLCYLALGYGTAAAGVVDKQFLDRLTKLVFTIMFPFMTFNSVYSATPDNLPSTTLLVFCAAAILIVEGILLLIVPRLVKENPRRGVIIQAIFRSNFVLFGIPLTTTIYGSEKAAVAGMLIMVVITIYNITSVLILEMFNGSSQKIEFKSLLIKLMKNPMLQGCFFGIVFFALGIHLPKSIETPIKAFANMSSPLALFALGGTLQFNAIGKNLKYIVPTLSIKLLILPLILVTIGYILGLRGVELFLVLVVFGTPVASGSYPMAKNMGGDGELAGQFVFISTVVSVLTIFVWIFSLAQMGLLAV